MKWDNYQIKGLPPLIWGSKVTSNRLVCPKCGSNNIYYSGTPADPEEVFRDAVRCRKCGWLTDYYEMYKQGRITLRQSCMGIEEDI